MLSRTMDRSYKAAISMLNGRRRPERPSVEPQGNSMSTDHIPEWIGKPDLKGVPSLVGMKQWLSQIGHSTAELDRLNIVHVAGTKGKGSTCAFIESFLRSAGERTGFPRKIGLYTSPHLIYPEERIRINFQPIARNLFAKYFFEVWEALSNDQDTSQTLPRYLQLIALVSFHAFIKEGVDAAIIETHHGGEYDSTNVFEHPVATVITPLGMDHVKQLGPTIENIAWHKAGIIKGGTPAFSSRQEDSATEVIRRRASEKGTTIHFIESDCSIPDNVPQLKPDVQRTNCSVALAVTRWFLEEKSPNKVACLSSSDISKGINQFYWPGRFQLIKEGAFNWFLDGAHNEMSIVKAAEWFIENSMEQSASLENILIFSQQSKQRDSAIVLERLAVSLSSMEINSVIFTTAARKHQEDSVHEIFGAIWRRFNPNSRILYEPDIPKALDTARQIGEKSHGMQTLVTGSLHLVGATLFSLKNMLSVH